MLEKIKKNPATGIIVFILIFGVFVGLFSVVIERYIFPYIHPLTDQIIAHPFRSLGLYFLFAMVASVIVPIPTLPIDLLLLNIIDPISVVTTRILGGIAGGSISYFLAYNYGRPLLKRWLSKKNYHFVESQSNSISVQQFFVITMVPIINAELMAFVGGLGKIGYRKTIGTLLLAIAYRVLFVYFVKRY